MRSLLFLLLLLSLCLDAAEGQQMSPEAEGHFLAAQEAQRGGDLGKAEREYRAAAASLPNFAELHMNLGLVYQMEGRTTEAMSELRRALDLKPGLEGAELMLGIDLCRMGEGKQAAPLLTAVLAHDPKRVEAYLWLATAQEISGDYRAELLTIRHAGELAAASVDLASVDLRYLEGHAYELLGQREVLRLNAVARDARFSERLLGESYATSNDWTSAVLHFETAIGAAPREPELHVERGEVLLRAGKRDAAIRDFDEELRIDSGSVRGLVRRGEAGLLAGQMDGALRDWSRALEIDAVYVVHLLRGQGAGLGRSGEDSLPTTSLAAVDACVPRLRELHSPASRLALAYIRALHGGGEVEAAGVAPNAGIEAETCSEVGLRRALSAGRVSEAARCGRGVLEKRSPRELRLSVASSLLRMGESPAALEVLDGAGESEGQGSAEISYLRARCFEELSTEAYLRLYRLDPNSFRVHELMGDLAAARDDDKAATEEYRAAIALKPTAPNLHYSLGHVLWKNSDIAGARAEFAAELALTPTHAGAFHDMGETYLMEHQSEKALACLKQAVGAGGHGPDLDRDLGTAYAQMGQYGNAAMEYKLALASDRDGSIHFKLARVYRALGELEKASRESAIAADLSRKYHARVEKETPRREAVDD